MATAKKSAKKTVRRSAPRRQPAVRAPKSFAIEKDREQFVSFKVTDQTVYWLVFSLVILLLGLWMLKLQIDVSDLLNSIQASI